SRSRDRPVHSSPPLFAGTGGMLTDLHDRGIDRHDPNSTGSSRLDPHPLRTTQPRNPNNDPDHPQNTP
ncbi:MAG TPA: hypothetical protein VGF17_26675, partial [Phytomonospora sp.]